MRPANRLHIVHAYSIPPRRGISETDWSGPRRIGLSELAPPKRRCASLITLAILALLIRGRLGELRSEERAAAEVHGLANLGHAFQNSVTANIVWVGSARPPSPNRYSFPFPTQTLLHASEENTNFIYACGDVSESGPNTLEASRAKWTRRVLFLQPGIVLVDDLVQGIATNEVVHWAIRTGAQGAVSGRQLRAGPTDQELICQTLWPLTNRFEAVTDVLASDGDSLKFALAERSTGTSVRFLNLLYFSKFLERYGQQESLWNKVLASLRVRNSRPTGLSAKLNSSNNGEVDVVIASTERTFRLELPPPSQGAGWITLQNEEGYALIRRRPLPSGPLPGDLLENWDSSFRDRRAAEWDKGGPALRLVKAVDQGEIKPCRALDLGCGSGNDAIYLAGRGFDVTAVDISPTALSIAAEKAQAAGVRVNWVLADALALPALRPFEFIFDRGCYHNVRYVNAAAFAASLCRVSDLQTRILILSLDEDKAPGVREHLMREDFSAQFEVERLEKGGIEDRAGNVFPSWSLHLRRKPNAFQPINQHTAQLPAGLQPAQP